MLFRVNQKGRDLSSPEFTHRSDHRVHLQIVPTNVRTLCDQRLQHENVFVLSRLYAVNTFMQFTLLDFVTQHDVMQNNFMIAGND